MRGNKLIGRLIEMPPTKFRVSHRTVAIDVSLWFALLLLAASRVLAAASSSDPAQILITMAQARFGALSEAELTMLRRAPSRQLAWASKSEDPDDPINDVAKA